MSIEASRPAGEEARRRDGVVLTLVKGGLVGIANIIPGVSGGTFALILGIFDRMIGAINGVSPTSIRALLAALRRIGFPDGRRTLRSEVRRLDLVFLVLLGVGAVAAILSSSFLIKFLLERHHSPTLAFFVGLILPSIAIPWSMMTRRGSALLWALPGIALTFGVSQLMPDAAAGSDNLLLALLSGGLSVSAMILPGLSGSYVLLVMGQYQNVLEKLTVLQRDLAAGSLNTGAAVWLAVLAVGMAIGIVLFARLLNFLLNRFRSATLAFLIGLLIGSLWVLWPFKDVAAGAEVTGRGGDVKLEIKIATAPNRLPRELGETLIASLAFAAGLAGSAGLIAIGKKGEISEDAS